MSDQFIEVQAAIQILDDKLDQIRRILAEFPEDKLWERPGAEMVSLGNLVCHVAGSMRDWIENGLAQGSWDRGRQNEFDRDGGLDRGELLKHLDETRAHCNSFLLEINEDQWNQQRQFRDKTYSVREIVLHQLEHVAYHAGQAAFLRRLVAGLPPAP